MDGHLIKSLLTTYQVPSINQYGRPLEINVCILYPKMVPFLSLSRLISQVKFIDCQGQRGDEERKCLKLIYWLMMNMILIFVNKVWTRNHLTWATNICICIHCSVQWSKELVCMSLLWYESYDTNTNLNCIGSYDMITNKEWTFFVFLVLIRLSWGPYTIYRIIMLTKTRKDSETKKKSDDPTTGCICIPCINFLTCAGLWLRPSPVRQTQAIDFKSSTLVCGSLWCRGLLLEVQLPRYVCSIWLECTTLKFCSMTLVEIFYFYLRLCVCILVCLVKPLLLCMAKSANQSVGCYAFSWARSRINNSGSLLSCQVNFFQYKVVHGYGFVRLSVLTFDLKSYWLRKEECFFWCIGVDLVLEIRGNLFRLRWGIPGFPIFSAVEPNWFVGLLAC